MLIPHDIFTCHNTEVIFWGIRTKFQSSDPLKVPVDCLVKTVNSNIFEGSCSEWGKY